ncbi:MAG: leucine-rich repeat protein [Draconibacterium sp.]|nr:leucine-rich repeat protein [Draconibacterium sp.]
MKLTFLSIVGLCLTMMLQAQVSKTLEVAAGGLKTTLTPTELTTITNLTLTGTIDARDFKTMRDEMPLLAEINLSEVNVIAYQGDEGTSLWGNTDYLANTIPEYAFSNGSYQGKITLLNAVLPTSVTTVMEGAFNSCSELLSVTLPLGLKTIGYSSFHRCLGLTAINLPDGLTTIGDAAFHRCTNLTSITVPSTVTYIGRLSLGYSSYIEVDENNVNYSSNDGVLFNKTQTSLLQYYNSADDYYIIPSSVTMIGQYAFYLCENLNSAFIPSSVTAIGFESFAYCSGLESISIPSSVNLINHQAFNNCYNLNSIYSYPISAIDLNASVNVFNNVKKTTCILYVPFGSKTAYESANQWQDFENIVEMPGIFLSGNTVKMGENDGTASININSSADWTATSDQPWLTVNPSTGATGSDTITFTATANPGLYLRTATVTISATGLDSQTIIVTQAALSILTVSSDSVVIGATANSTAMFKITSFPDWTATSNQPWLTLQPSSFVNTTIYAGTYSASGVRIHPTAGNIFYNNKEEILTMLDDITIQKDFAGDYAVQTQIQLTQNTIVVDGKTMILVNVAVIGVTNGTGMLETDQNGNPTNYFDPSTRTYNLSYFYNTVAPRNIYEVLIGVATTSTITLTASANPASSIRQTNVTISASGVQDKIVKVTQDASPVLAVSTNSLVMQQQLTAQLRLI